MSSIMVQDQSPWLADDGVPNVLMYIDNSNIFEMAKKYSGKKKGYRNGIQDVACRIDIGALMARAVGNRRLLIGRLYGSEPPALDSVWEAIRKKQIHVQTFQRSKITRKEKECDQSLTANAVEDIIIQREDAGENRSVILFSGDRDLLCTVKAAIKYGYRVEIWSFHISLNKAVINYAREEQNRNNVEINYIENIFDDITFTKSVWGQKTIPPERSLVAFVKLPEQFQERRQIFFEIVAKAGEIFQLPMSGKYRDNYRQIILVPYLKEVYSPPPLTSSGARNGPIRNYDFYKDVLPFVHILQEHLNLNYKNICSDIKTWNQVFFSQGESNIPNFASTNRFQKLQTPDNINEEDEEEDDKEDFSYESAQIASEIEFENDSNIIFDMQSENISDTDDYYEVEDFVPLVGKVAKRKMQIYSNPCIHKFWCSNGRRCAYKHTEEEKEFFKLYSDFKSRVCYKIKPCYHNLNNTCKYSSKSYLCPYAHSLEESRCLCCGGKGNGIHWMDQCPHNVQITSNRKKN